MCESPLRAAIRSRSGNPPFGGYLAASFELAKEIVVARYQLTIKQKTWRNLKKHVGAIFGRLLLAPDQQLQKTSECEGGVAADALLDDRVVVHVGRYII
jgi:hypothetical protein